LQNNYYFLYSSVTSELSERFGLLPANDNDWATASREARLYWNMAECDICGKNRRFPPHFERFFPLDKEFEFACDMNVWDKYRSCEEEVEEGCNPDDPMDLTFSEADMKKIRRAGPGEEMPKANKKAKVVKDQVPEPLHAGTLAESGIPKRGRGRPKGRRNAK